MNIHVAFFKKPGFRKFLQLLLKVCITIVCFWYLSTKIYFDNLWKAFLKANWGFLLLAVALLILSKILSSIRLNIYFRNMQLHLSEWKNLKLYWLGMFYNLFLPGAISGDAYKVILLNRRYQSPYKKIASAVLLDRFSGLLALGVILSICGIWVLYTPLINVVLISGAIIATFILYLFIRIFFIDFLPGFFPTFFWGIAVQTVQVVCIFSILLSLRISLHQANWILIFLVAAIISVLPISLGGGLGTRELIFAEGSRFFHLDPQVGVIISLLFFLTTILSSIWGAYFVFQDPLK